MAKFQRTECGSYEIVDTRNGMVLKRNVKSISKAAAYVRYYDEEIAKAEAEWAEYDSKGAL